MLLKKFILITSLTLVLIGTSHPAHAADTTDTDGDGLSDYDEVHLYHTDPNKSDTDGDSYSDQDEVVNGFSPLIAGKKMNDVDTDSDGLNDAVEIALSTDLTNQDTDHDGYADGIEVANGFNPLVGDKDRSLSRTVKVDLTTQQLSYYLNQVKVGSVPVSTGLLRTQTPAGTFSIMRKLPIHRYTGPNYDYPNTKWNMEFKRSYYLHEAYWHHEFGKRPMSHGCVNLATADAATLYKFLDVGDKVSISGKTPRVVKPSLALK